MPVRIQNTSQHVLKKTIPMPARTQNVPQLKLNEPIPYQRIRKLHLNTWRLNPFLASEDTKAYQHLMTTPLPWQRRLKMHFKLWWPKSAHSSEITEMHLNQRWKKILSTPSRILFASQHVLTKPLSCLRGLKMILKICCPNPSHTNEDTKYNLNKCWPNS